MDRACLWWSRINFKGTDHGMSACALVAGIRLLATNALSQHCCYKTVPFHLASQSCNILDHKTHKGCCYQKYQLYSVSDVIYRNISFYEWKYIQHLHKLPIQIYDHNIKRRKDTWSSFFFVNIRDK